MSNDDNRRRRDGSTAQLSVADLLARREAETQPIPRITDDEETVRFPVTALATSSTGSGASGASGANLSGRELHITELLRREGRAGEEERGGGFSVPKLVAMASGGVVLAGTVAFTASNLLSSPDERPLAEVRFDARAAARANNTLTKDLGTAGKHQAVQQTQAETTTTTPDQTAAATPEQTAAARQRAQGTTQQQTTTSTTTEQSTTTQAPSSSTQQTTTQPPSTTATTSSPSSSSTSPSSSTTPPSSSTPPSSTAPSSSTPPPSSTQPAPGLEVGLDLGGLLKPIGGFDFFAPAN